jgi:hypothetical protein
LVKLFEPGGRTTASTGRRRGVMTAGELTGSAYD